MWSIRRLSVLFFIVFVVVTAMSAHLVWRYQYQSLLLDHQSQLDKFSSLITAKLDKYAHIPRLLSKDKELVDALLHPANTAQIEVTNRYLEQVNDVIQAADTYLLDQYGNTLAASNWNLERSFIGRNFAWRPYFYQSIAGLTANTLRSDQPPVSAAIITPTQWFTRQKFSGSWSSKWICPLSRRTGKARAVILSPPTPIRWCLCPASPHGYLKASVI